MTDRPALRLHEEVMLLSLRGKKGTIEMGAWYHQAVGGAVLAELALDGRVRFAPRGRKSLVKVVSQERVGDMLVDEWLGRIAADEKTRQVGHWVAKIAGTKDLKGRIARGLARRGVVRVDEDKVLLLFTREVYPELDPEPERELRERLRAAVLEERGEVDPRTSVLLSLMKGTGLLELVFDKRERKAKKARIEAIVNGEACGKAARDLVAQMHVIIVTACVIPAISS